MIRKSICIASTEELAGKSTITVALATLAKERDMKVGYFKPIGFGSSFNGRGELFDEDVETLRGILNLKNEKIDLCPILIKGYDFLEYYDANRKKESVKRLKETYENISKGKDIVLIEGPHSLPTGSFLDQPFPKLAAQFDADIVLVVRYRNDFVLDEISGAKDYCSKWGAKILGVIFNHVPKGKMSRAKEVLKPLVEDEGLEVLGFIPEDIKINALTVDEIYKVTQGRILAGKNGMNKTVGTFLVGAMTPESATMYFRKAKDELVITGGDRTDIILSALETGASALILTGNLYPSIKIFPRADELEIPIILVPYDTFTALQLLQKIVGRIKPGDQKRIERAKKLVKDNVKFDRILF